MFQLPMQNVCVISILQPTQIRTYLVPVLYQSAPSPASYCYEMLEIGTSQATVLLCQLVLSYILPIRDHGGRYEGRGRAEKAPFLCVLCQQWHFSHTAADPSLCFPSTLPELAGSETCQQPGRATLSL